MNKEPTARSLLMISCAHRGLGHGLVGRCEAASAIGAPGGFPRGGQSAK